jgi:hypothetical protein
MNYLANVMHKVFLLLPEKEAQNTDFARTNFLSSQQWV